jgi:hypothetical protein
MANSKWEERTWMADDITDSVVMDDWIWSCEQECLYHPGLCHQNGLFSMWCNLQCVYKIVR